LITLDSIFISPFDAIFGIKSTLLFDITRASILLFSMLFIYEFIKEYSVNRVNQLIKVIIYLTISDILFALLFTFTIFTNFIPIFISIWLVLSEANRQIEERDTPFYALLIGWYIVVIMAIMEYVGLIDFIDISFPFIHVTFAIESIFLSLAISYKFKLTEEKQKMQQSLLLQQSRLASMGEMISIIAHQWRQPLNFLSVANMHLEEMHKEHPDSQMLISESNRQIIYMSNTIDSFRNFYNPSKEKKEFSVEESLEHTFEILSSALKRANIKTTLNIINDFRLYGNKNEFEQVLLNIINNAKDALIERKIANPLIQIEVNQGLITIEDNAKGIDKQSLKKIFDPYFSTKKDSDGIGLYISKVIIEQEIGGRLEVLSNEKGTKFRIIAPKHDYSIL
jgi:signal transduction histidine kinase